MGNDIKKYSKDQIVYITSGSYSDYYVNGIFRVLKDFTKDMFETTPFERNKNVKGFDYAAAITGKYLEELDAVEIWSGEY